MNISTLRAPSLPLKGRWLRRREQIDVLAAARAMQRALVIVGLLAAAAAAGVGLYGFVHTDRIYEGVMIGNIPVGGLSQAEARSRIEDRYAEYLTSSVPMTGDGQVFTVSPRRAGMSLDSRTTAEAAFNFGRSGPIWERAGNWVQAALGDRLIEPVYAVDERRLDSVLIDIAHEVTRPPVNAAVAMSGDDGPMVRPEEPGVAFDLTSTRTRVLQRFSAFSTEPVSMVLPPVMPDVTASSLTTGLQGAQAAVASPLVLSALDTSWTVATSDLKRIVSVPSEGGEVRVDRDSLLSLIQNIAAEIERPSQDARLYVTDDGEFAIAAAARSVEVDVDASVDAAAESLLRGSHDVDLVVDQAAPAINDDMAAQAMQQAEALIDQGVELEWPEGSARLGRGDLIASITIGAEPGEDEPFTFGFDGAVLSSLLEPITAEVNVEGQDARFRLEDGKVQVVKKAKSGRAVDIEQTVELINEAVLDGTPSVALPIDRVDPMYTEDDRAKIKVDDVLGDSSTYYGTSSEPRRRNVEQAVKLETGWLIPPDGVFSYNEYIGEVTEEQGFVTGFGIVANGAGGVTTAPVIGGGICQVSTTIFQASYWAGLEIVERWTHPYWINTYGEAPRGMKGLDAMVNIEEDWSLDLKMRNTTGNWIALVVRADGERVSAQILGANPGWTIDVQGPEITNVVTPSPDMIFTESSELPAGQELQVESAQEGFDAAIRRVITDKDGQVIADATIAGTYSASHNTILRGTGEAS
ncbi:MAG: peptidoglycan binding domain-containing protein [Thermomicrobiales bacterium]